MCQISEQVTILFQTIREPSILSNLLTGKIMISKASQFEGQFGHLTLQGRIVLISITFKCSQLFSKCDFGLQLKIWTFELDHLSSSIFFFIQHICPFLRPNVCSFCHLLDRAPRSLVFGSKVWEAASWTVPLRFSHGWAGMRLGNVLTLRWG